MLSSKCGWLVKRNEQHVWQKRWCCVVPHTFLYYFEASPEVKTDEDGNHEVWSGGGINLNAAAVVVPFQNVDQEALNAAVKDGYDENDQHGLRLSLYPSLPNIMGGGGGNNAANGGDVDNDHGVLSGGVMQWDPDTTPMNIKGENSNGTYQFASSNLQPVGIIDLECYSVVNRSKLNPTVLELAGDAITNPDLRSFYFQSATIEDAECWTKALLMERHQSLKDETEAYRQVCESFPLQLTNLSEMINEAEAKAEKMEKETYAVRCAAEEGRRKVVTAVREMLERKCWETEVSKCQRRDGDIFGDTLMGGKKGQVCNDFAKSPSDEENSLLDSVLDSHFQKLETNRAAFLRELEAALASPTSVATSNVVPPVQSLVDYTSAIVASFGDLRNQLQKYEKDLVQSVKQDQTQLEALKCEIQGRDEILAKTKKEHDRITSNLEAELEASRRKVEELTKQLEAQRMEFGMYQNATKTKMSELQQHKKILKKEVLEMRKKIDESETESTSVAHEYGKVKNKYQSQKDKNVMLALYIEKLEKQVGIQQNMMEMMSQTGGASFVGKMVGPGVNDDSKDVISLSGMSVGSNYNYRRQTSNLSSSASAYTPLNRRPLLPRNSSKSINMPDISPIPVPSSFKQVDEKDQSIIEDGTGEDRNPSTDTTTDAELPADPVENGDKVSILPPAEESSENANEPTISTRLEEKLKTPERILKSPKTPENNVVISNFTGDDLETPIRSSSTLFDATDDPRPQENVVSLNESLLSNSEAPTNDDDDDDDDVSRVSDITEDRTQRQIDDDLAERRRILLAYVNKQSSNPSSSTLTTERRLETIETMLPDMQSQQSGSTRLSVAQRAKLASNNRPNNHRSPSQESKKEISSSATVQTTGSSKSASQRSKTASFMAMLGKAVENAFDNSALAVGVPRSESLDSDKCSDDENENSNGNGNDYDDEDDRASEVASEVSSTLQERMALQRERQVSFLKKKKLIADESRLKGGAGAASITTQSAKNAASPGKRTFLGRALSTPLSPVPVSQAPVTLPTPLSPVSQVPGEL